MINVELKGGAVKEFENGTTPAEIAKSIGAGLYKSVCCAKVDGDDTFGFWKYLSDGLAHCLGGLLAGKRSFKRIRCNNDLHSEILPNISPSLQEKHKSARASMGVAVWLIRTKCLP